ncbi:MAG: prepilin-type N-terminal cleavage/methylation domain-containing protein [Vampirovibrionales bacterium]
MSLHMPSMERGFSLAEVVISLAVLGLIASLTLPSLSHSGTHRHYGGRNN